jgi:hypothetical protein
VSTYVSIGRNVRGEPMSRHDWADFCTRTRGAIRDFCGTTYSEAYGEGEYNGVGEECHIVVAPVPTTANLAALRAALRALAAHFGQECIALTIGHTEMVSP